MPNLQRLCWGAFYSGFFASIAYVITKPLYPDLVVERTIGLAVFGAAHPLLVEFVYPPLIELILYGGRKD